MSELLLIQFTSEATAEEARHELMARLSRLTTDITNSVIATKTPVGNIKVNQLMSSSATAFPAGGVRDVLAALLYWPSARASADPRGQYVAEALHAVGLEAAFLGEALEAIQSGHATLLMLLTEHPPEEVLTSLPSAEKWRSSPYDEAREPQLKAALEGLRHAPEARDTRHAKDETLTKGLEDTFPASDPVSIVNATIPSQRPASIG